MKLRKIPLGPFIEMLQEIYNNNVDFIDISGTQDSSQDVIEITVEPDYFTEEEEENSFTDGDINDLI